MNFNRTFSRRTLSCLCVAAISSGFALAEQKSVTLQEAGTIASLITPEEMYNITELIVAGPINGTDILFIRDMLGRGSYGSQTDGKLESLDLTDAKIVEGGESYIYSGNFTETDVIGNSMFDYCENLKHLKLPANITEIGSGAFYHCSSLEGIDLPETLTTIYSNAFFYAESIPEISIPKNVKFIDEAVFCGCASLKSFSVDPENDSFSAVDGMLCDKDGKVILAFPGGRIGDYSVAEGFVEIAPAAFNECLISSVTLPEGIVKIGDAAFSNSYSLESIWLPNSLMEIESNMFTWCDKLSSIHFPENLETIKERAFLRCGSISSVMLPASVKTIEDRVFANCGNLESVTLSSSLESFGIDVFISDKKLTAITVPEDNKYFSEVDGVLFNADRSILIKCPEGKAGELTVPEEVKEILDEAFYNCAELTSVCMAHNVETIGSSAFSGCTSLESVLLSEKIAAIPVYLFESCTNLKSVNLGNVVESIDDYAFSGCSHLDKITFPASLKTIGSDAFSYCSSLAEITAEGEVPPVCTTAYTFYGLDTANIILNVPASAVDAYRADETWSKFNICGGSDVHNVEYSEGNINVYTLEGNEIYTNVNPATIELPAGIYIFRDHSNGTSHKILIK